MQTANKPPARIITRVLRPSPDRETWGQVGAYAELADRNNAPLRGPAYAAIFSLLFGLGLRVGEVARLRWRDVDRNRDVLTIRETKFSSRGSFPWDRNWHSDFMRSWRCDRGTWFRLRPTHRCFLS
ncbi:site-specific integrase (plasmid) [Mesorhizobium mediterraneum]|uniref:site-specific integrase n=1 Tax=Mesorhizobium TaxID=68287 RepID=UPI001FD9B200|nr:MULTISPECIES: site-specific integrase [Mesorhizobium]WIW57112.1 site-specific integrase [Mesorhizobium mediterraneum]